MAKPESDMLYSITRLVLGSVMLTHDELQRQIKNWEQETARLLEEQRQREQQAFAERTQAEQTQAPVPPRLPAADKPADMMRYAMIGLMFETQSRFMARSPRAAKPNPLDSLAAPLIKTLQQTPVLNPLREPFDQMVRRGQSEVNRWVSRGRLEEYHSRQLIQTAATDSFESSVHSVVENAEVRALVQAQGEDLASEVVEEVRERAVSIDTYIERFIRFRLGRKPREELPDPPESVRMGAAVHQFRTTES
jgi:hypothetical protein